MADITARGMAARAMTSGGGGGGGTTVDAYNKQETDNLLRGKANVADVYNKTETGELLEDKVDKISGKGLSTNDYTNEDMSLVKTISNKANETDVNENISNLQGQIDTVNDTLTDFETEITTKTGYSLGMSIDASTYVMTMTLKNSKGSVVSTQSIDLPIESMVIDASYANGKLNLTLQNGTSLSVDISSIVSGLVKDTFKIAGIDMKDNIEANELRAALGVYTTTEVDNKLDQKANASTTYSKTEVDNKVSAINTNIQANTTAISATNERVTQNESDILNAEKAIEINRLTLGTQITKNILKLGTINPTNGLTVTVNPDKSLNVNGTVDSFKAVTLMKGLKLSLGKRYTMSISDINTNITLTIGDVNRDETWTPTNTQLSFTPKVETNNVWIQGTPGTVIDNVTLYPMIRSADTDGTYEPHVSPLQEQINEIIERLTALETAQTTATE
jgi:hypothetical protein